MTTDQTNQDQTEQPNQLELEKQLRNQAYKAPEQLFAELSMNEKFYAIYYTLLEIEARVEKPLLNIVRNDEEAQRRVQELEQELEKMRAELELAAAEEADSDRALTDSYKRNQELEQRLQTQAHNMQQLEAEATKLARDCRVLLSENQQLQQKLEQARFDISRIEAERDQYLETYGRELKNYRDQLDNANSKRSDIVEYRLAETKAELEQARYDIEQMRNNATTMAQELAEVKRQLDNSQVIATEYASRIKRLETERDELQQKLINEERVSNLWRTQYRSLFDLYVITTQRLADQHVQEQPQQEQDK